MGQFTSRDDYRIFANEIKRGRYIHSPRAEKFIDAVRETVKKRILLVPQDWEFWRAQSGCRGTKVLRPHAAKRMKPLPSQAIEGRVNPKGTPCLYGARDPDTAIAEIRPLWIGEIVSLALLKVRRDLQLVECLKYHAATGFSTLLNARFEGGRLTTPTVEDIERDVWTYIDKAFSEPISKTDDKADYVPTQVIAELFENIDYDGVLYKSRLSTDGVNVAFFDPKVAVVTPRRLLYEVTNIKVTSQRYEELP
jgi:hypothetical protein